MNKINRQNIFWFLCVTATNLVGAFLLPVVYLLIHNGYDWLSFLTVILILLSNSLFRYLAMVKNVVTVIGAVINRLSYKIFISYLITLAYFYSFLTFPYFDDFPIIQIFAICIFIPELLGIILIFHKFSFELESLNKSFLKIEKSKFIAETIFCVALYLPDGFVLSKTIALVISGIVASILAIMSFLCHASYIKDKLGLFFQSLAFLLIGVFCSGFVYLLFNDFYIY